MRTSDAILAATSDPRPRTRGVNNVEAIALEGGGVRGLAYGPALRQLFEDLPGGYQQVRTILGSSAGFLTALAVCLTHGDMDRVDHITKHVPWDRLARFNVLTSPPRLLVRGGFASLQPARKWIRELLAHYTGNADITLGELRDARGGLVVGAVAADVFGWRPRVFNAESDPDVVVWKAALASMAIPLVWPAVWIEGRPYVDGGALLNLPLGLLLKGHPSRARVVGAADLRPLEVDQVVGLRLDTDWEAVGTAPPWPTSWTARVAKGGAILKRTLAMIIDKAGRGHVPAELWPRVIRIPTGNVGATDFNLTGPRRRELRTAGRQAYEEWKWNPF